MASCMMLLHVTKPFTSIALDRIELESFTMCHCVCPVMTAEMQYDLLETFIRPGHLVWPKVRNSYWHFGFKSFRCDSTRGTRWCLAFSSAFPSSKVIFKNVDNEVSIIFCLTCPGNAKMWTKIAKSGIDGFRTSLNVRVIPCRIALAHLR